MKKHLMIAGCSYSAPSITLPGTSWSEIMADRLGWNLTNLARQGCSNGGIRIQIEEIRRQRPDFAVVSATFWDRMEIPARSAPYVAPKNENKGWGSDLQKHLQDRNLKNGYNRADGINNVNYKNNNYNMICETIFSLSENCDHAYRPSKIDRHTQQAIKIFIDTIYDSEWKKQQDEWIIREGVIQLYLDGINFLFLPNFLWPFDPTNTNQWREAFPSLIPDHYLQLNPLRTPQVATGTHPCDPNNDPGYHGDNISQELIASWHLEYMKNGFGIA